jgi:hypothetical protein
MSAQKWKGRLKGLTESLKILVWLTLLLGTLVGSLSCNNSGTSSTSSSSGSSGTGTGWTITIQLGTNSIVLGNTTSVVAIVKDSAGAPAPLNTNVCMTAVKNGFLDKASLFATLCGFTTNNLGQMIQTYGTVTSSFSGVVGNDTIEVSSQGVIARATITVLPTTPSQGDWAIDIQIGTNPVVKGNTTTVLATVRDRTSGTPAPSGTTICMTAQNNNFLDSAGASLGKSTCNKTTNALGQLTLFYSGANSGTDTIEVSSQGVISRTTITVN